MIAVELIRSNSDNKDFSKLISLLDEDLNSRYGQLQKQYNNHNQIDAIDTVVIATIDKLPVGCGCFRQYDNQTVEIKRMFVKSEHRGKGIAQTILSELEKWAKENGFSKSLLETGIKQHEAISLYRKCGYKVISNYGQYVGNSNSVCMSKEIF